MEQVLDGKLTIPQAAQTLNLSERQVKRLKGGMQKEGVAFLAHKNRGRKPKHALPQKVCDQVVNMAQNEYRGASCEHIAELMELAVERQKNPFARVLMALQCLHNRLVL